MNENAHAFEEYDGFNASNTQGRRLPQWIFCRLLGLIYFCAIASFWSQSMGLIGESGIVPADVTERQFESRLESGQYESWMDWPTLFYFMEGTDNSIHILCFAGILFAIGLCVGVWCRFMLIGLWTIYLSLVTLASPFLPFQWDLLLLEMSVVAFFYAPGTILPGLRRGREPNIISIWLLRIILFKLMLSSGIVKLISPDPNQWQDLSALNFHFWTQPIPHQLSFHAHHLGEHVREMGVFFNHVVELVLPWLILCPVHRVLLLPWLGLSMGYIWIQTGELGPESSLLCGGAAFFCWIIPRLLKWQDDGRWARTTAGMGIALFMLTIAGTGNYGFFNLLTIALTVSCFDDRLIMAFIPKRLTYNMEPLAPGRPPSKPWYVLCALVACILVPWNLNRLTLSVGGQSVVAANTALRALEARGVDTPEHSLSAHDRFWLWTQENEHALNESLGSFHIVRNYGLFATMTTSRYELRIEGSHDGRVWKPLKFRYKPDREDDLHFAGVHMPRLDWQMWFVSLWSGCQGRAFFQRNWWFFYFLDGVLAGAPDITELLESNPFERKPPRYVRVLRDRARFSTAEEYAQTGQPWVFERVQRPFCPALDRDSLKRSGIRRTP